MPQLLGVYVFTDRPPRPPPAGVSACTAGLLCRRCWASTSSPTGRLVRRRLVFPPARVAYYAAVVGHRRLHRPAASSAADWCFRLHGWPIMPPLLGVNVFTDRPPHPPPTGVSAGTAGLLCCRCWASTSSPAASSAADRCFYLHDYASSSPVCFCCLRLVFTSSRLCNFVTMVEQLHLHCLLHRQTHLLLLRKFFYFTNHDVYKIFDISACTSIFNAVLFYYNKWLSNIQDFYLVIFNTYLQSSDDYSTTRSYTSRLYVQLFPN
uniref:HGWP repeat containing protein-like n=1 Tax=Oryza sativa subsp. japonica TaxID=39947 RepID=Q7EYV0_ORYSJ|nr:HGWP repeat containing protein-like [Oryza sativa Japonica Group]